MSKLQDLINELCPNGVEFKKLGEVAAIERGSRVVRNDLLEEGTIPVYQNSLKPLGYYDKFNYAKGTTFIIAAGAAGEIGYSDVDFWAADDCYCFIPQYSISPKYIYYCLLNGQYTLKAQVRKASIPRLSRDAVAKFELPVPPMAVQEEIVRILDRFADYTAELQAELQARKEQYEYYRNLLLTFNPSAYGCGTDDEQKIDVTMPPPASYKIEWKTMGEIGNICMCKRILKNQTKKEGDIPFYKIGTFGSVPNAFISRELYEEYKAIYSFPRKGDILISAAGTIGKTVIFDGEDSYFQDSNIVWISNDESMVINKYLYYYYQIVDWKTDGGTIKRLYNENLSSTPIAIPPIDVQQRIVEILDRFETLVNDLTQGLPAEIEARKQQYEYYRNQLLTFKKLA
jgi:type I restriction enzyme S subunit